mgnify:CR=1 FL=1
MVMLVFVWLVTHSSSHPPLFQYTGASACKSLSLHFLRNASKRSCSSGQWRMLWRLTEYDCWEVKVFESRCFGFVVVRRYELLCPPLPLDRACAGRAYTGKAVLLLRTLQHSKERQEQESGDESFHAVRWAPADAVVVAHTVEDRKQQQ